MLDFSATFIITLVNITVLFFVLRAILFKPVSKFMSERANRIQASIDQAEKDKAQAKALLERYEACLKTAETEAANIISGAREQAEAEAANIIAQSRGAAETVLANARKQAETEHSAALASFRKEAASLVVTAAAQLVGREIQPEDNSRYARALLENLPRKTHDEAAGADNGSGNV